MTSIENQKSSKDPEIIEKFKRNKRDFIYYIETIANIKIKNKKFFIRALICSAFAKEYNEVSDVKIIDQDELATFGDALLGAIICEMIFLNNEIINRKELTERKKELVNNNKLQEIGIGLGLQNKIYVCNNETAGKKKIATTLEALFAAIYLSNGMKAVKKFIHQNFTINKVQSS